MQSTTFHFFSFANSCETYDCALQVQLANSLTPTLPFLQTVCNKQSLVELPRILNIFENFSTSFLDSISDIISPNKIILANTNMIVKKKMYKIFYCVKNQSMKKSTQKLLINLTVSILSVGAVFLITSLLTNTASAWYKGLTKPGELVPQFVFSIVWSAIYVVAAIILIVFLQMKKMDFSTSFLFVINGVLNIIWCIVFFISNSLLLGVILIIFNLIASIALWVMVLKKDRILGLCFAIYPLWLMIATSNNLAFWMLN